MKIQFLHLFWDGALTGERCLSIHKQVYAFVRARLAFVALQ